jgi:hypothetical protein
MTVRAIEYEILPRVELVSIGLTRAAVESLGTRTQVAVLRCVDGHGEKLTAVGDADRFRCILASGEASDPAGMKLQRREFPVVVRGWPKAS